MKKALVLGLAAGLLLASGCRHLEVTGRARETNVDTPPYLSWPGEPVFEEVPGTGISYMKEFAGKPVGPDYDICRAGRHWYWFYKGHWFTARKWQGRWKPARKVPEDFLKIPRDHPLHRAAVHHPGYRKD